MRLHEETSGGVRSTPLLGATTTERASSYHNSSPEGDAFVIDIDTAIDSVGEGLFQERIVWAAGLCFASDSIEVLLLSFLAIVLQAEWGLSDTQKASITSIVFVGAIAGTLTLGPIADRIGRKPVFCATAGVVSIFGVATAFCNNFYSILLVRMFVGFGFGGATVQYDTLAEFLTTSHRGDKLALMGYFYTAGTLMLPVIAFLCLGQGDGEDGNENGIQGWRLFVFICSIPSFAASLLGLMYLPESPRWLLTKGRPGHALEILRQAARENGKDVGHLFPPHTVLFDPVHAHRPKEKDVFDLWTPEWRRFTGLMWASWFGFVFLHFGTILVVTLVFSRTHAENIGHGKYSFDYGAIFSNSPADLVGTTLVMFLMNKIGRIRTQVISFLCGGVSIWILCHYAASSLDDPAKNRWQKIVASFLARLFYTGGACAAWVSTSEILTTDIRTTGHSFANASGRLGALVSSYLLTKSFPVIGAVLFLLSLMTAFTTSQLPETSGKRMGTTELDHQAELTPASLASRED